MRLLQTKTEGETSVQVYWNREFQEYQVRTFVGTTHKADYFTDDKADAYATADVILREATK